jgi:hypothetical protein
MKDEETICAGRQCAQLSLQNSTGLGQTQDGAPMPLHSAFLIFHSLSGAVAEK